MEGWIKIHRQSLHSSVMKNPVTWHIWCWCLMKATHVSYNFPFNGKDVSLRPGQFITGRTKALEELKNCTARNYRTAIRYLKTTNRIATKTTNRFTIISICNWEKYQSETTSQTTSKVANKRPTNDQPATTYKNIRTKEQKKEVLPKKVNPLTLTRGQWGSYLKEYPRLTLEEIKEQRLKCNNYMGMSSNEYNNPGLFFKGWLKRIEKEKITLEAQKKRETRVDFPEISEEERQRNLKKLSEIRDRFKGGVAK